MHIRFLDYRSANQSLTFDFSYIEDFMFSLIFYDLRIKVTAESEQAAKYAKECGLKQKVIEVYW